MPVCTKSTPQTRPRHIANGASTVNLTSYGGNKLVEISSNAVFSRNAGNGGTLNFAASGTVPAFCALYATGGGGGGNATVPQWATVNGGPATYDTTADHGVVAEAVSVFTSQAAADWSVAGTWTPAGPPTANSDVVIKHAVTLNVANTLTVGSVKFSTGGASPGLSGAFTLNLNGTGAGIIMDSGLGAGVTIACPVTFTAGTEVLIANNNNSYSLTLSGLITGNNGMTTSGVGLVILSANNSGGLTGSKVITVSTGKLSIDTDNELGVAGNTIKLSGGGTLQLTGGSTAQSSARNIAICPGSGIEVTNTNATTGWTLSGTLSDAVAPGSLTKSGSGILTLSNNNSYSGGTTINTGTVAVAGNTALGSGTITLASGKLQLVSGGSSLTNAVTVNANSTIDVTGLASSAISGALTIGANTLSITGGSTGANAAYTLTLGNTGGVLLTGNPIFDVAKNGSGMGALTLGALNDGGTAKTITLQDNGTLTLGAAAASLVNGATVNITGSAILNSNNATALGALAAVTLNDGCTFSLGASQTIGSLGDGTTATAHTAIVTNSAAATLTVGSTNNLTASYSGVIQNGTGNTSLIKAGTGTLTSQRHQHLRRRDDG